MLSPFSLPLPVAARPAQGTGGPALPAAAAHTGQPAQYVAPSGRELVAQTNLLGARVDGVSSIVQERLGQSIDALLSPVNDCQRAITAGLQSQLAAIAASCRGVSQCIADGYQAAVGRAREYAAVGGCPFEPADLPAVSLPGGQLPDTLPGGTGRPFCEGGVGEICPQPLPVPPAGPIVLPPPQPAPPQPVNPIVLPPPPPPIIAGGGPWPPAIDCSQPPPPIIPPPQVGRLFAAFAKLWNPQHDPPVSYQCGQPGYCCGTVLTSDAGLVTVDPGSGVGVGVAPTGQGYTVVGASGGTLAAARAAAMACVYALQCPPGGKVGSGPEIPLPVGPPAPSPCPPPPTCPACGKPACDCACIDECQKKSRPKGDKWCIYKRKDGTCYVVRQAEPTEIEGDELVECVTNETEAILKAQKCAKENFKPQPPEEPVAPQPGGGVWCSTDVCDLLAEVPYSLSEYVNMLPLELQKALVPESVYNAENDQVVQDAPAIVRPLVALVRSAAFFVLYTVASVFRGLFCSLGQFSDALFAINFYRAVVGLIAKFVGPAADDAIIAPGYTAHYLCPQQIPTTDQAQAAYLSDSIDKKLLECWTAANNDCPQPFDTILDSKRQRLGVGELVALYLRGEIDLETYRNSVRQLGFLETTQADQYLTLAQQIPPVSELIRMMVRDVADEGLVTEFGMDKQFTDKWQGQLKQWGENQGIPELFAKYEWRAHWSIPAPGQLYQMYHRLRNLPDGDPNRVTVDTLKTALAQQDILPYWQDKFIAISFNPLTRIDAGRAYEVGALPLDALEKAYLDLGYDDSNAQVLANFKKRQLAVRLRSNSIVRLYRDGNIPKQTAYDMLLNDKFDPEIVTDALAYTETVVAARSTAACLKSLKKRYLLGEVPQGELPAELNGLGLDGEQISQTVKQWGCERASRGKLAPAATLCKWFKRGLINVEKYAYRLANLGWTADEITSHLAQCQGEIDDAKLKEQLKKQKEQEAMTQKQLRQVAQLARQQEQAAVKAAKAALREAKLSRKQQQNIVDAGRYVMKAGGSDWTVVIQQVLDAIALGMGQYKLDAQAAIDAALAAAKALPAKAAPSYPANAANAEYAEYLSLSSGTIDGSEVL